MWVVIVHPLCCSAPEDTNTLEHDDCETNVSHMFIVLVLQVRLFRRLLLKLNIKIQILSENSIWKF